MGQRLDLQAYLEFLLESPNVYFEPPENVKMSYPAIRYTRDYAFSEFADNRPYQTHKRYAVTYIDWDPDSDVPDKIMAMPMCSFGRAYKADNLNHTTFSLYF
jgi:hypothetical protein